MSDAAEAYLRYVARIEDPNVMPPNFGFGPKSPLAAAANG